MTARAEWARRHRTIRLKAPDRPKPAPLTAAQARTTPGLWWAPWIEPRRTR